MQTPSLSVMWAFVVGCLAVAEAYPGAWPAYAPRDYPDDDYYYAPAPAPKVHYYYGGAAPRHSAPEVYGRVPYPFYYDSFGHYANEDPVRQEERLASLPVGQETWFESETEPSWRNNEMDDVNAAFLDNLILTQMAQDAQRRRENARTAQAANDYEEPPRNAEDEDVRELKALAGKPFYHEPKTAPRFDDDDYPMDDGFINWNGNKRSATAAPPASTARPRLGQDEVAVPRPAPAHRDHHKKDSVYDKISQLLESEAKTHPQKETKARRIDKRFVATDGGLVAELRGLKHRIRT
ncbi:uncharacterized protein LOC119694000 [Plutella xylostella]|uniref:uncharacterized protein LOC119694000 n=1 Tax=Plutella xylostella TaxID=51655 RepID=UPI002032D2AE|nr:uncharacterized protein LOC119694000 [Plutella xylostella]